MPFPAIDRTRGTRGVLQLLGVAALSVVTGGCEKFLGVDYVVADGGGSGGRGNATDSGNPDAGGHYPGKAGGFDYRVLRCATCMDASCGPQASACALDPTCNFYIECIARCRSTDVECPVLCQQEAQGFPFLSPEVGELLRCRNASCDGSCGATVHGATDEPCGVATTSPSCAASCCAEKRACHDDPGCIRAASCLACKDVMGLAKWSSELVDDECFQGCMGEVPDAGASWMKKYDDYKGCAGSKCNGTAAGPGADTWGCLGHVAPPTFPSTGRPIHMYISVLSQPQNIAPIPTGIAIAECQFGDINCNTGGLPIAQTDLHGVATFEAPAPLIQGVPGLVWPYFKASSIPGYYPLILWPFHSVTSTSVFAFSTPDKQSFDGQTVGIPLDPQRGHVAFVVGDCANVPPSSPVHVKVKLPDAKTVVLGHLGTDARALDVSDSTGLIVNAPTGLVTIEYSLQSDQSKQVGHLQVVVAPGSLTLAALLPTAD
jgi:hypothetical protein